MSKIISLPKQVYDKISAGEVVERPCAVIKELVENSIDAGATRIDIEIEGGGLVRMSVTDNGCGIDYDQLNDAFKPHATSKISQFEDLDTLSTMGFRGEALYSISSVSCVTRISKTPYAEVAGKIVLNAGHVISQEQCAFVNGTKVVVENLFYNVPARKKFLKTPTKEASEITNYVARLILTHPELEVFYKVDGKNVYYVRGGGLAEAIYTLYGQQCLDSCIKIDGEFKEIKVKGYVSNPDFTKSNSTFQTISINGRYVKDPTVLSAIKNAFKPYLMTKCFPVAVLDIQMDPAIVDVNVHPTKMEVRYAYPGTIYLAVFLVLKNKLKNFAELKAEAFIGGATQTLDQPTVIEDDFFMDRASFVEKPKLTPQEIYEREHKTNEKKFEKYLEHIEKAFSTKGEEPQTPQTNLDALVIEQKPINEATKPTYRVLGVLFLTYIVLEVENEVLFIDQHAAHERILYDKFIKEKDNLTMQPLLIPYVFDTTAEETDFLENNLDEIAKAGFSIEKFGQNTFRVVSVATMFVDCKLEKMIANILSNTHDLYVESTELLKDNIAKHACRLAIKGGERISQAEIDYIVYTINTDKIATCPHGRPLAVRMTKYDFEKMFKRVV
ncbi:MAG: DNA mismatch repair endonuclease MutL [Clostridia bacterium]|nr:DNA mismatch repair endonuclease MutL [Clostridia bacterium]